MNHFSPTLRSPLTSDESADSNPVDEGHQSIPDDEEPVYSQQSAVLYEAPPPPPGDLALLSVFNHEEETKETEDERGSRVSLADERPGEAGHEDLSDIGLRQDDSQASLSDVTWPLQGDTSRQYDAKRHWHKCCVQ